MLRGAAGELATGSYGTCQNHRDADLADTRFDDDERPTPGESFTYLVRGRSAACPAGASYGTGSGGEPRTAPPDEDCR